MSGHRMLQLALDFPAAWAVAETVADLVDVIEIGTPLLKRFGLSIVTTARQTFPAARILADSKTVDGGYAEASMLFEAGADMITVLSETSPSTWAAVDRASVQFAKEVLVDTVLAHDPVLAAFAEYPGTFTHVAVHVSMDSRADGSAHTVTASSTLARMPRTRRIAVAGGVSLETLGALLSAAPDVVIVGRAITAAADPRAVARAIARAVHNA